VQSNSTANFLCWSTCRNHLNREKEKENVHIKVEKESVDVATVEKILKDIERNFRSSNNVEGGLCPSTSKFYGYFRAEILRTLIIFSKVISEGGYPGQ
jgi:hypothetical protein